MSYQGAQLAVATSSCHNRIPSVTLGLVGLDVDLAHLSESCQGLAFEGFSKSLVPNSQYFGITTITQILF